MKPKAVKIHKEGHYVMIKESIHRKDVTVVIIYVPNIGAPENLKQKLTGQRRNSNTVDGDSNSLPLTKG